MSDKRTCPEAALASPFFDGELAPRQAVGFERHLKVCPACRAELRAIRRLSQLVRGWGFPGPWETGPEDELETARVAAAEAARATTRPYAGPAARPAGAVPGPSAGQAFRCASARPVLLGGGASAR